MSKIALSPNAGGTATFTIASPGTSTDRTLTLPDNSGTVLTTGSTFAGTGPAFSYFQSVGQTLASETFTKITFTSSEFDTTGGMYASSRFTPTVAGYYQITFGVAVAAFTTSQIASIYKNGSQFKTTYYVAGPNSATASGTALIYLNGSTDYVEIYLFQNN